MTSDTAIDLLYEALAAANRGMHALAAIKAARASNMLQKQADDRRTAAHQGDITTACLPPFLQRQSG